MQTKMLSLWRSRDFMKLWTGETISLFGSSITQLALPLIAVSTLNATAGEMGILTALQFLPTLLIGLFVGVWVDRMRRRPVLMVSDFGRALILLTLPLAALTNHLSIELLYIVALIHGTLTIFFDVAYQSYLPALVSREHIVEGNSKLEISRAISSIAGPGLAGILIKIFTAPLTITLDSLSFLASAFFLWRIDKQESPPEPRQQGRHIFTEVREGLGVVFGNPMLRSIAACTSALNLFNFIGFTVLILFMKRNLGLDDAVIGLIYGLGSIGGLVGALVSQKIADRLGIGPTIIVAVLGFIVSGFLLPLASVGGVAAIVLLIAAQIIYGLAAVIYNVNQISLRQVITPDRLQGRMNASMRFLVWATIPLGSLISGFLGERIGLINTLWVAAIGFCLPFLWIAISPVRHLKTAPAPAEEPSLDVEPITN